MAGIKPIVLINDGGMDGLVASGMLRDETRVVEVFVRTGREGEGRWWDCFERQVEGNGHRTEVLEMRHLVVGAGKSEKGAALGELGMLTGAAGLAVERGAKALVWPVRVGADADRVARITETLILLGDLIEVECGERLAIETPLLELTDQELVEVGVQMGVDWGLSRSCVEDEAEPCTQCEGCVQRSVMLSRVGIKEKLGVGLR